MFYDVCLWDFGPNDKADGPSQSNTNVQTSDITAMPRVIFDVLCTDPVLKQTTFPV